MSSTFNKQLEFFLRRETLLKLANNFVVVFGTIWLFIESAAFFFAEYLSNYRSTLFLVIFASAFVSSFILSFPKLQYGKVFSRLNVEVAVKVGDVLKEIENGACNVVFSASDTFTIKTEVKYLRLLLLLMHLISKTG
jgi:hypothetical protein